MVCGALTAFLLYFSSKLISKCLNSIILSLTTQVISDKMEQPLPDDIVDKRQLADSKQLLDFSCDDGQRLDVFSKDVLVKNDGGAHTQGSSLIKLKNIVDYNWEHKLYVGQVLAVHISGDFLAYAVKGGSVGMVRVTQRSSEKRALLKGMQGLVQDLSFAHIAQQVLLAVIDSTSTFFIYELLTQPEGIASNLLVSVAGGGDNLTHRIVWCSYVPEEGESQIDDEEDPSKLFVSSCGNKAYVWNLTHLINKYGNGPLQLHNLAQPYNTVDYHTKDILEVTFSPDGSALATASKDGLVKFFQPSLLQVYDHNDKIKCIHQWSPHGEKPVSSLFFLDSRTVSSSDQFWKYVVTGYDNVIKVWSCKDWSCIQTITFSNSPFIKLGLSLNAEQLLVSDITRRILYVLDLDDSTTNCHCTSISHFCLPFPFLSFADVHIGKKIYKCPSTCTDLYHSSNLRDDENDSPVDEDHLLELDDMNMDGAVEDGGGTKRESCSVCSILHLYVVQPKSLQHASITLPDHKVNQLLPLSVDEQPVLIDTNGLLTEVEADPIVVNENEGLSISPVQTQSPQNSKDTLLAQQSQQLKNILFRQSNSLTASSLLPAPSHHLNLMTPDAFSSPPKREVTDDKEIVGEENNIIHTSSPLTPTKVFGDVKCTASGGSSPSREVQEILSVKDADFYGGDDQEEIISCQTASTINSHTNHNNSGVRDSLMDDQTLSWVLSAIAPTSIECENESLKNSWPSINMDKINEANQRKVNNEVSVNNSFAKSGNLIDISADINGEHSPIKSNNDTLLQELTNSIRNLTMAVNDQQKEIGRLRTELSSVKHYNDNKIEDVRQVVDAALTRHGITIKQSIDSSLVVRAEAERLQRDSLLSGVSQIVGAQLGEKLSGSVAHEARTTLLPALHNILEPIIIALKTDLAHSLSTTDRLLTENIQKLVNSKSVMEGLCSSVGQAVGESSRQAFREAVQASLVPPMEKALAQMLEQLNSTFTMGVKEYLTSLENYTKRTSDQNAKIYETSNQLNKTSTQLQQALEQQNKQHIASTQADHIMKAHVTKEIQNAISISMQGLLENQAIRIKGMIEEVVTSMSKHVAHLEDSVLHAVRSGAQTPAPVVIDTQQQIDQLLQKGELNGAFQTALNAADLRIVVHCCRNVDPSHLSQKPCPLQQNVLLSLIQQLGADMTSDTNLKYMFLQEAVTNLDTENPVTKEHMPGVLSQLKSYLFTFLSYNPSHESSSNIKILRMAIDSLLKNS